MDKVEIFNNKKALAQHFGKILKERSEKNDKVTIALSGGSTPKVIFDELVNRYADIIDWTKIYLFWGDERCVLPTDEQSNYKMTVDHLLAKVSIPEDNVYRVEGELTPDVACEKYQKLLHDKLKLVGGVPQFDMMLLGMGDDGHTASIFPNQIELWNDVNDCVVARHPVSGQKRVSLTGRVINQAKEIFFLVTGAGKVEKLEEILLQKENYKDYPASLVIKPVWLVDKEAVPFL